MTSDYVKGVRKREARVVYGYNEGALARAIAFWRKQGWRVMDTGRNKKGMFVAALDHVYIKELAK